MKNPQNNIPEEFEPIEFLEWNFNSLPFADRQKRIGIFDLHKRIDASPNIARESIYKEIGEKYHRSPEAVKHWYYKYIRIELSELG